MTDEVRTALRERVARQSSFLSPVLGVFLLAIANLLPEEKDKPEDRPAVKGSQAKVALEDGSEFYLAMTQDVAADPLPVPAAEEAVEFDREMWERVAQNIDILSDYLSVPDPYYGYGLDSTGRVRVAPFYMDRDSHEIGNIIRLYFGNENPFFTYHDVMYVEVSRKSWGVTVTGVRDYSECGSPLGTFTIGCINFVNMQVGYADPETGRIDDFVPLRPEHWSESTHGHRHDYSYDGAIMSGYCTPSRYPLTQGRRYGDCHCRMCR